jgi:hypothetical protein
MMLLNMPFFYSLLLFHSCWVQIFFSLHWNTKQYSHLFQISASELPWAELISIIVTCNFKYMLLDTERSKYGNNFRISNAKNIPMEQLLLRRPLRKILHSKNTWRQDIHVFRQMLEQHSNPSRISLFPDFLNSSFTTIIISRFHSML